MPDNPKTPKIVEVIPSVEGGVSAIASSNAPVVFFDLVGAHGTYGGVAHITLLTMRFMPAVDGGVSVDHVVPAYLRCNLAGLAALKGAIAEIEGLLTKPASDKIN